MDGHLTLISSNIRFDNPADGSLAWPHRRSFLAELLRSHQPDIIGTQEGRRPQIEDLAGLLPDHNLSAQGRQWIEERMYPCLFFRKNSFGTLACGDAWLSDAPQEAGSSFNGSAFPRLCTWNRISLQAQSFFIANVHLDYLDEGVRLKQALVLVEEIKKQVKPTDRLILMGDFNDAPGSQCHGAILEGLGSVRAPWIEVRGKEEPSHRSFTQAYDEAHRIDWIFVDHRIEVEDIFLDKSHRQDLWPSDHYPLVCKVKL